MYYMCLLNKYQDRSIKRCPNNPCSIHTHLTYYKFFTTCFMYPLVSQIYLLILFLVLHDKFLIACFMCPLVSQIYLLSLFLVLLGLTNLSFELASCVAWSLLNLFHVLLVLDTISTRTGTKNCVKIQAVFFRIVFQLNQVFFCYDLPLAQ